MLAEQVARNDLVAVELPRRERLVGGVVAVVAELELAHEVVDRFPVLGPQRVE